VIALGSSFLAALALDQGAKALALAGARDGRASVLPWLIRVRLVSGAGTAIQVQRSVLTVVWALAATASILALELGPLSHGGLAPAGLGLALGGAGSNLVDRIFRGGVVDFVDLRVWPVFNPADVAILAGLALVLFSL
jgi:signal peptidase II